MSVILRPYQREALAASREALDAGIMRQVIVAATGAGKTVIFSHLPDALGLSPYYDKVLILAHREELIVQARTKYLASNPGEMVGIEKADNRATPMDRVAIGSVQTLRGRRITDFLQRFGHPRLVITDEVHHATAGMYQAIYAACGITATGNVIHVGVTATPKRSDGVGLQGTFDRLVYSIDLPTLIAQGYLVPLLGYRVQTNTNLDAIHTVAGDFNAGELADEVNNAERNARIVAAYRSLAEGRKALVFAASVAHSQEICAGFRSAGYSSAHVDGATPLEDRQRTLRDFARGDVQVLTNCQVLCLDEQTEILTQSGWVGIDDMRMEHEVATWDDGRITFERPIEVIRRDRAPGEDMVSLQTNRRSIRVTGGHRLLRQTDSGVWEKIAARDLVGRSARIPVSGHASALQVEMPQPKRVGASYARRVSYNAYSTRKYAAVEMTIEESKTEAMRRMDRIDSLQYLRPGDVSIDQAQFIGFWIGDGSRSELQSGGIEYSASQSQAYPHIIAWFDGVVDRIGIDVARRERDWGFKHVRWSFARGTGSGPQSRRGVLEIEPYMQKGGSFLWWGFSEAQFDALLHGLWMADGNHGDGLTEAKREIFAVDKSLLDLLQAIAVCRGYRATVRKCGAPRAANHRQLYRLSYRKMQVHYLNHRGWLAVESEWIAERVWCVRTVTGTIITRRNGSVTIMGNCEGYDEPSVGCVIIAKPTKSPVLYSQMVGRATRLNPGKDDAVVIDMVDNSTKHSVVTIPSIFGMPSNFDLQGRSVTAAAKAYAKLMTENPDAAGLVKDSSALSGMLKKPVNERVQNLVRSMIDKARETQSYIDVNLLKPAGPSDEVASIITMAWSRTSDDTHRLQLKSDIVAVKSDLVGTHDVSVEYRDAAGIPKAMTLGTFRDADLAYKIAEDWIQRRNPDGRVLLDRAASWRNKKASEKQCEALKKFRIANPEQLTKGEASQMLDQLIGKARQNRLVTA